MSDTAILARIHEAYACFTPSQSRVGYPREFQEMVARYTLARRQEGWSWREISNQLPVSSTAASTWMARLETEEAGSLVAVQVVDDLAQPPPPVSGLVLTSPAGYRLTGMTLDQAALLLGHLG